MSKLTATPYIESVLAGLSDTALGALLTLANGSDAEFQRVGFFKGNKKISELENGVYGVKFEDRLGEELKIGYLVKKESGTHLLCYSETSAPYVSLRIYKVENVTLVFKDEISSVEYRNYLVDKRQSAGTVVVANPELEGDEEELESIEIDGEKFKMPSGGGGETDTHTVTIDGDTISLAEFIAKCEAGDYGNAKVGTIATMHNLIDGKDFRIILIGVNHDVLSCKDAGELEPNGETAKTTWHFYDMPMRGVKLGLPYVPDVMDGEEGAPAFDPNYPSNWFGYPTATSLLDALQTVFSSLPKLLQDHIKTVRKDHYVPVLYFDDYESYNSTKTMIQSESDRYGWSNQKLFCLSATEVGVIPDNDDDNTQHFPYSCEANDETIMLEGKKYAYFNETKAYESEPESDRRRPRYFGEEAYWYWLRSPNLDYSRGWGIVNDGGFVDDGSTGSDSGLAPAFCI